jgi:hypothetical protein
VTLLFPGVSAAWLGEGICGFVLREWMRLFCGSAKIRLRCQVSGASRFMQAIDSRHAGCLCVFAEDMAPIA